MHTKAWYFRRLGHRTPDTGNGNGNGNGNGARRGETESFTLGGQLGHLLNPVNRRSTVFSLGTSDQSLSC